MIDVASYLDSLRAQFAWIAPEALTFSNNEIRLTLPPDAPLLVLDVYAFLRRKFKGRFVELFANDERSIDGTFKVYYVFSAPSDDVLFILQYPVNPAQMELPSISGTIPAALWFEQEMHAWYGIFSFPNVHRLAVHADWPESMYEMQKDFPVRQQVPRVQGDAEFHRVEGEGIFEIPVGPVHAGIIEPGHFRFSVAGEPIISLEAQLFYTHKGTEKLAEGLPPAKAIHLAERVSGDSSFAHALAYCHSIERLCGMEIPMRALILRTVLLELERIYNHIGDMGAILLDVGFALGASQAFQLKEQMLHLNEVLTGSRLLRAIAAIGGVKREIISDHDQGEEYKQTLSRVKNQFQQLIDLVMTSSSVLDRLETTGRLKQSDVYRLGVVGIAARASGVARDLRRDHPHCTYPNLEFHTITRQEGDVLARFNVRKDEVLESFYILSQLHKQHRGEAIRVPAPPVPAYSRALGYVEGWRGEIFHWTMTDSEGKIFRWHAVDPSFHNWRALEIAVRNNIVPDFPVINKSFNLSYSGNDR